MTRLLVDYHHADLYESHQLVFGDRFGWDVFAPYGMEWFDEWYWNFERPVHGDAVARQYLLGVWAGGVLEDGIMTTPDAHHPGRMLRGVTLERAKSEGWDFVMSTVPQNAAGFAKFARETGAEWFVHIGNQWGDEQWDLAPAGAIVTTTSIVPPQVKHVVVHQEFRRDLFGATTPDGFGPVRSFVNCFPETPEYPRFLKYVEADPSLSWEVFGSYGTAPLDELARGNLDTTDAVAAGMRDAGVIWHQKYWSDGFGHVIHNAFASGRPVFGSEHYYRDKLAGPLWVEGVTSFDVDALGTTGCAAKIRELRDNRDAYLEVCAASAARFDEIVDFAADAEQIGELFGAKVPA